MSAIAPRRARRGVMLVEILMALAISGLIAGGVASLLLAVANGSRDSQELRRRNVRVDVLGARIDAAIRSSRMVLGRDDTSVVLWIADSNNNAAPNLSELRRIEWEPTTKQLLCFEAPATLADASNPAYDLPTTDFVATTAALRGTASFPSTVWANEVIAWSTSPAVTRTSRLISYEVTIEVPGGGAHATRSSTALRGTGNE
ncbi:MAG TPA: hypothetical protein VGR35_12270 [Tepidisphaeraceae bacterium]|nr:hypothetical protein [Tepidisphaeraceae bacterium]